MYTSDGVLEISRMVHELPGVTWPNFHLISKSVLNTKGREVGVGRPAVGQHVGPLLHPPLDDLEESGLVPLVILAYLEETLPSLPGWDKISLGFRTKSSETGQTQVYHFSLGVTTFFHLIV